MEGSYIHVHYSVFQLTQMQSETEKGSYIHVHYSVFQLTQMQSETEKGSYIHVHYSVFQLTQMQSETEKQMAKKKLMSQFSIQKHKWDIRNHSSYQKFQFNHV